MMEDYHSKSQFVHELDGQIGYFVDKKADYHYTIIRNSIIDNDGEVRYTFYRVLYGKTFEDFKSRVIEHTTRRDGSLRPMRLFRIEEEYVK